MTVRVRFAPSPTGLLHIGNARAALINWLFSKKHHGQFILRLDDTDLERSKPEYATAILQDLAWLGLEHDVYFQQSARFERYHEVKNQLIEQGLLYECFETQEELEFKRKRQLAKGKPPIYDRESLHLTTTQKAAFIKEGRKSYWRFLLKDKPIKWHDLVRGETEFQGAFLSDPVLIKADGQFLYSLCSVIDDVDYNITHIIRGEDHVANTASQIQIFEALGVDYVQFAHTTLLMDAKGQALSKRLGSLSLQMMREMGIEPMAINCLLARLGTSLPVEPILNLTELSTKFSLSTFSRTPPHFDENDLYHLNHKLYHLMTFTQVQSILSQKNINWVTEQYWQMLHDNLKTLDDLKPWEKIFFSSEPVCDHFDENMQPVIKAAVDNFPSLPWAENTWSQWTKAITEATGIKGKSLFMTLRLVITGLEHGPEMKKLICLIGEKLIKQRLLKVMES